MSSWKLKPNGIPEDTGTDVSKFGTAEYGVPFTRMRAWTPLLLVVAKRFRFTLTSTDPFRAVVVTTAVSPGTVVYDGPSKMDCADVDSLKVGPERSVRCSRTSAVAQIGRLQNGLPFERLRNRRPERLRWDSRIRTAS